MRPFSKIAVAAILKVNETLKVGHLSTDFDQIWWEGRLKSKEGNLARPLATSDMRPQPVLLALARGQKLNLWMKQSPVDQWVRVDILSEIRARIHLRASVIAKIFRGLYPQTPVAGGVDPLRHPARGH